MQYTPDGHHHIFNAEGPITVVSVQWDADRQEANARLIAAAPELYALAQLLVRAQDVDAQTPGNFALSLDEAIDRARALLARIDGQEAPQ